MKAENNSDKRTMNRYELQEKIGEGTFGDVYQAKKKGVPGKVRRSIEKFDQYNLCHQCSSHKCHRFTLSRYSNNYLTPGRVFRMSGKSRP